MKQEREREKERERQREKEGGKVLTATHVNNI